MKQRTYKALALIAAIGAVAALTSCEATLEDHDYSMSLVNQLRRDNHTAALETNLHLIVTADRWAATMRDRWVAGGCTNRNSYLQHTSDIVKWHEPAKTSKKWQKVGENVGVADVPNGERRATISVLHDAYSASPDHRANMLDRKFRWTGQALVYGPTQAQSDSGACPGVPVGSVIWSVQAFVG